VDHPSDLPPPALWRSAAFIAVSVATVELLILLVVGIWLFGKFFADEVDKATDPVTVAQAAVERELDAQVWSINQPAFQEKLAALRRRISTRD